MERVTEVGSSTVSMNPFTVPNRANLRIWMWIWLIPTDKTVTVRNCGYLWFIRVNDKASWTDAERAFSKGRREVNFMQHNMPSQTFKAEMAVGSWDGTPLMPNISEAIRVIKRKMARGATSGRLMMIWTVTWTLLCSGLPLHFLHVPFA